MLCVPTRVQVIAPIAVAAFIIGIVGLLSIPSDAKLESVEFPRGTIKIDNNVLEVQIADTDPRRIRGLMFQEQLPYDQGMLFVFDEPGIRSLWMINMQFSLDMIWFDKDGNIVHVETGVPPCESVIETMTCPSQIPSTYASYVLEVTEGFVEKFNINKNSKLEIISI